MAKKKRKSNKDKKKEKATKKVVVAGSMREKVKRGEVTAEDALAWLYGQEEQSRDLETWLRNRISNKVVVEKVNEAANA